MFRSQYGVLCLLRKGKCFRGCSSIFGCHTGDRHYQYCLNTSRYRSSEKVCTKPAQSWAIGSRYVTIMESVMNSDAFVKLWEWEVASWCGLICAYALPKAHISGPVWNCSQVNISQFVTKRFCYPWLETSDKWNVQTMRDVYCETFGANRHSDMTQTYKCYLKICLRCGGHSHNVENSPLKNSHGSRMAAATNGHFGYVKTIVKMAMEKQICRNISYWTGCGCLLLRKWDRTWKIHLSKRFQVKV